MSVPAVSYQCAYEGCAKRYATTDAVKKHAKKAHPEWTLADCRKKGAEPTFYNTVDPSTESVVDPVRHGEIGHATTEASRATGLNPMLIAAWTPTELRKHMLEHRALPADLYYVHMTDQQRHDWIDSTPSVLSCAPPRHVTIVLCNEHGRSEQLAAPLGLVASVSKFNMTDLMEKVRADQYWIALCIELAKCHGFVMFPGMKRMKELAAKYDPELLLPPPPPSREAVQAMFDEACKKSLTKVQASLSKLVRDGKK